MTPGSTCCNRFCTGSAGAPPVAAPPAGATPSFTPGLSSAPFSENGTSCLPMRPLDSRLVSTLGSTVMLPAKSMAQAAMSTVPLPVPVPNADVSAKFLASATPSLMSKASDRSARPSLVLPAPPTGRAIWFIAATKPITGANAVPVPPCLTSNEVMFMPPAPFNELTKSAALAPDAMKFISRPNLPVASPFPVTA